jgi:hypothetical protein
MTQSIARKKVTHIPAILEIRAPPTNDLFDCDKDCPKLRFGEYNDWVAGLAT